MRLLLALLFCALSTLARAQKSPEQTLIDSRLYEVYDSSYLDKVLQTNPALIRRWNFYLDNAFMITDFPEQKGDVEALPVVRIPDPTRINILLLEKEQRLSHDWKTTRLYRIEGTSRVLMYYSGEEFNRRLSANLK